MDVYMEAYLHVTSREARRHLAQVMVDLMHQRPRIELTSNYFVLAYRYECAILRLKTSIMKQCLNNQVCGLCSFYEFGWSNTFHRLCN